mgnify:CR=1 FL=1
MNPDNKKTQTALVTGATGFLGTHLCMQLQQKGWQVYALCRSEMKAKELPDGLEIIIGDILHLKAFVERIPMDLDAIFHTAASTNTWFRNNALQTNTNIQGTQNMLDLANEKKVKRFIHVSSVVVFGIHKHLSNISEDLPKSGENSFINYVRTKTAAEKRVLESNQLDTVVINPTHIIGPGDRNNWARLIKMIAEKKLPSIPNGAGSFVDVRDVASGIISAFYQGKNKQNYLLGGTDMNFTEFVHRVAKQLNVNVTRVQLPNVLLKTLAHIKNTISRITNKEPDITPESVAIISDLYACDAAKARKQLGYQTRDFSTTLEETIQFLKDDALIN